MKELLNLTGKEFHYLRVLRFVGSFKNDGSDKSLHGAKSQGFQRYWECLCACGRTCTVSTNFLKLGFMKHCKECDPEMIGKVFYYLTIIKLLGRATRSDGTCRQRLWQCRCICGAICEVLTADLRGGRVRHCPQCNPEIEAQIYLSNYKAYREFFTVEQRKLYQSYLRGRKGTRIEAEAVDVTLRDLPPAPDVHLAILGDKAPARLLVEPGSQTEAAQSVASNNSITDEMYLPARRLQAYENTRYV